MDLPDILDAPWEYEERGECFLIKAHGRPILYIYFEDREERRMATKRPTKDEARRVAQAIVARVPGSLAPRRNKRT